MIKTNNYGRSSGRKRSRFLYQEQKITNTNIKNEKKGALTSVGLLWTAFKWVHTYQKEGRGKGVYEVKIHTWKHNNLKSQNSNLSYNKF